MSKTILYWEPPFQGRDPRRLTVADTVASAFVRTGLAAPADPGDAAALNTGGALDAGNLIDAVLEHGTSRRLTRMRLPMSVATIAVAAGIAAGVVLPITGQLPPVLTYAQPIVAIGEAGGVVTSTLTVDRRGVTGDLVVNLSRGGTATSGTDYAPGPGSVTIPAGQNSVGPFTSATIIDDAAIESAETIVETASLADYPLSAPAVLAIAITDNDVEALPANAAVSFGELTRRGYGAAPLGYVGAGALSITAGNGSGLWAINSDNQLVLAGTSGTAPPALAASYALTVASPSGLQCAVNLTVAANTAHVAPSSGDTATAHQLQTMVATSILRWGDTVLLRSGNYFAGLTLPRLTKGAAFTQRSGGPATPVAESDAGWVRIASETPYGAIIPNLYVKSNVVGLDVRFDQIDFFRPAAGAVAAGAGAANATLMNDTTTAISNVRITRNRFRSAFGPGYTAAGQGGGDNIYTGLRWLGPTSDPARVDKTWITDNEFSDALYGAALGGRDNVVRGNVFRRVWVDCINGFQFGSAAGKALVEDNLLADKIYGDGSYHGDFIQVNFGKGQASPMPTGSYFGPQFRRNKIVRGLGRTGFQDGQGIYVSDVPDDVSLTDVVVENNLIVQTFVRAISLLRCVGAVVARNTILQDQQGTSGVLHNPAIVLTSCMGGTVERNVVHSATNGANNAAITETTPISPATIAASNVFVSPANYAATFAAPVFGDAGNDVSELMAGFAAKVSGAANIGGTYSGALDQVGSYTVGVVPLAYSLVAGFDALPAGFAANAGTLEVTSSRKVLGAGAVQYKDNGVPGGGRILSGLSKFTDDMAGWDVIAFCIDTADANDFPCSGPIRPRFTVGGTHYIYVTDPALALPASYQQPFTNDARGKRWVSFKVDNFRAGGAWANASVKTTGTAEKTVGILFNEAAGSTYATDITFDALVVPAAHKPCVMFTWDDANVSQFSRVFPEFQSRGFVGNLYLPFDLVGTGSKLTAANIDTMRDAGWGIAVDADALDRPYTSFPTRAAAIAALNANRDAIINRWGDTANAKHVCQSYGRNGLPYGAASLSVTAAAGSNVLTVAAPLAYQTLCAGMRVRGAGVPEGTKIVRCLGQTTVEVDTIAIPAGTSTMLFLGRTAAMGVTCNGTTTVTLSSQALADTVYVGQTMVGLNAPAGTKITAISGTTLTMSNAVPTTCPRASFLDLDAEFDPAKFADDLIANGYRSARGGLLNVGAYTGYGLDPKVAVCNMGAVPTDNISFTAQFVATIQSLIDERTDIIIYGHDPQAANMDNHWNVIFDAVKVLRDANKCDVVTLADWHSRVSARLPIA